MRLDLSLKVMELKDFIKDSLLLGLDKLHMEQQEWVYINSYLLKLKRIKDQYLVLKKLEFLYLQDFLVHWWAILLIWLLLDVSQILIYQSSKEETIEMFLTHFTES